MLIKREVEIDAPIDRVWDEVANGFGNVHAWASSVDHAATSTDGHPVHGAPCAGRVCQTEMGPFKETIVAFDHAAKTLAYEATGEKMPFFVRRMLNAWKLTPAENGGTKLELRLNVDLSFPFSLLMGPPMKLKLGKVLTHATEEFKHYIETGTPHPRKLEAQRKAQRRAT